jgi:hypothetical protein
MFALRSSLVLHCSRADDLYLAKEISRPDGQLVKSFPVAIMHLIYSFY